MQPNYQWLLFSNNTTEWDIAPIIHDQAHISLYKNEQLKFTLGYKISKNIFWKQIVYADLINETTQEVYSFQVNNIFFLDIIHNDIKLIWLLGNEIIFYENYGKTCKKIEIDKDKTEITPLWYYDMFLSYDDDFYYPEVLRENFQPQIKRFYDYYGFYAYTDTYKQTHFILFLETSNSNNIQDEWVFCDNFNIISERVPFDVESWSLDSAYNINILSKDNTYYHIKQHDPKIYPWKAFNTWTNFVFKRFFEDTDSDYIVGEDENWLFVIERSLPTKPPVIIYYKKLYAYYNPKSSTDKFFIFENEDFELILVNPEKNDIIHTDILINDGIKKIEYASEWWLLSKTKTLQVTLQNNDIRTYII